MPWTLRRLGRRHSNCLGNGASRLAQRPTQQQLEFGANQIVLVLQFQPLLADLRDFAKLVGKVDRVQRLGRLRVFQ